MIKPFKEKGGEEDRLHRKYGYTDSRANAALEKTERYLIKSVLELGLTNLKPAMQKHFRDKIEFHRRFDAGEITDWRQFYRRPHLNIKAGNDKYR